MKTFIQFAEARVDSDDAFDELKKAGALNVRTTSSAIIFNVKGKGEKQLKHKDAPNGKRYVQGAELKKALNMLSEAKDPNEYDKEGEMAKTQLRGIVKDASHMIEMFGDDDNLPEWVQNKITKAADYLQSAHDYMMNVEEETMEEETAEDRQNAIAKQRADQRRKADKAKLAAISSMMDREKERQARVRQAQKSANQ